MRFRGAVVIPAALVVALTVVGGWVDGSSSSSAGAPDTTSVATATSVVLPLASAGAVVTPPTTLAGPPRTSCTSVVHIGDSTSVGLMSPDFIADPGQRIDAQYARIGVIDFDDEIRGARSIIERFHGEENALDVATREVAGGFAGCWVLALGTTDAANMHAGAMLSA